MKRARDLVNQLFQNIDHGELQVYGKLFSSWKELVGTDIAAHSRILEFERGILYIGVDHPGWMQMITMRKREILSRLKSRYASLDIRDLRLMLVDGVPEEELERRFSDHGQQNDEAAVEQKPDETDSSPPSEAPAETPKGADFQTKLEKLRESIEKKWG